MTRAKQKKKREKIANRELCLCQDEHRMRINEEEQDENNNSREGKENMVIRPKNKDARATFFGKQPNQYAMSFISCFKKNRMRKWKCSKEEKNGKIEWNFSSLLFNDIVRFVPKIIESKLRKKIEEISIRKDKM